MIHLSRPRPGFSATGRSAISCFLVAWIFSSLLASLSFAQSSTGTIQGTVFNPSTKQYIRNAEVRIEGTNIIAYTEDGGFYRLPNVPAGSRPVIVSYTGYETVTASVSVSAGATAVQNFELMAAEVRQASAKGEETPIMLQAFVVASEREGNAKAIMDQRAAVNAKSIVATDTYGELTMGDVGEFMRFLPGVALDYLEVDTNSVRIGGLDAKYSTFTQDGNRIAAGNASFGADTRGNTFEQMSITGIESIEINNTLRASMDADSAAGNINMKSKHAFERKGRVINWQAYFMGTSDALSFKRDYFPDDRKHTRTYPAGTLGFADVYMGGRLGIELNASYNASYIFQDRHQIEYDNTTARGPVIIGLMWRPGPKLATRIAGTASVDFKATPHLVFSLRSSYSHYDVEFFNQYTWLRATRVAYVDPSSTLTSVTAKPDGANTRLGTEYSHRHNYNDTYTFGPKAEYRKGNLTLTVGGSYSHSLTRNKDMEDGFFRNTNNRITQMSWQAERASSDSYEWNVTQLSGPDWSDWRNWGSKNAHTDNIVSNADRSKAQIFGAYIDSKMALRVADQPIELLSGIRTRLNTYAQTKGDKNWTYLGPTGNQLTSPVLATQIYKLESGLGGNINSLGWRADDTYGMYRLYQEHPEYFKEDTVDDFTRALTGPRSVKEQVDAGYIEGTTRWRKWIFNAGGRVERTNTMGLVWDPLPDSAVKAAGFTSGTIPFVFYKYRNGVRSIRRNSYTDPFFSGSIKYKITRNLEAQASCSQSVLRPDYSNIAGIASINETNQTVTAPNPNLEPEKSMKTYTSLRYYFEPAGTIGLSAYRLDMKGQIVSGIVVDPEDIGYAGDSAYEGYTFYTTVNRPGKAHTNGVSLEYNQRFTFLPGIFKGLGAFGSVTRTIADRQQLRLAPKSANGGISFRYNKLNLQLRGSWQANRLISITASDNYEQIWAKERLLIDFSGSYKISNRMELMFSVRNIFNAPAEQFSNVPNRLQLHDEYGSIWNLGIRGTF